MRPPAKNRPLLVPVGVSGIPRAEAEIARTIQTLRTTQFQHDPLFDADDSFRLSLLNSAVKREGAILEAAIRDAVEQTPGLRLINNTPLRTERRRRHIDVSFELVDRNWWIALEIKRGSLHDSTAIRGFNADLEIIPKLLRSALPLFPAANVLFHIVFLSGEPPIKQGLTLDDLGPLYGLHPTAHVLTARQRYSAAIKSVLRERGL